MSVLVFDSVTDELQHLADTAGRMGDEEGKQLYLRYLGHIRLLEAREKAMQAEQEAVQEKLNAGRHRNAELSASIQLGKKLLGQARSGLNKSGKLAKAIRAFLNYTDTNPIMVQAIASQGEHLKPSSRNEERQSQGQPNMVEKTEPAVNEQQLDPSTTEIRFTVDGAVYPNDPDGPLFEGDGSFPPFVIFDVRAQENLPGQYPTREAAETARLELLKVKP